MNKVYLELWNDKKFLNKRKLSIQRYQLELIRRYASGLPDERFAELLDSSTYVKNKILKRLKELDKL